MRRLVLFVGLAAAVGSGCWNVDRYRELAGCSDHHTCPPGQTCTPWGQCTRTCTPCAAGDCGCGADAYLNGPWACVDGFCQLQCTANTGGCGQSLSCDLSVNLCRQACTTGSPSGPSDQACPPEAACVDQGGQGAGPVCRYNGPMPDGGPGDGGKGGDGGGDGGGDAGLTFRLTVTRSGSGSGRVQSTPSGIDCGGTCSTPFPAGSSVDLTATSDSGSLFQGWGGACSGIGPCSVSLGSDKTVEAIFNRGATLSVTLQGPGSGTVTSSPPGIDCSAGTCAFTFASGTGVTLTATPAAGSTFVSWMNFGPCQGQSGPCAFTLSGDSSVTASFSDWVVDHPFPSRLSAVGHLGAFSFALGAGGKLVSSSDDVQWLAGTLPTQAEIRAVAVNGPLAVAVGDGGTVLTSPDGLTWTSRTSGTNADLHGVAYRGEFVAVGDNGTILSSPDGVTWTSRNSGTAEHLRGIGVCRPNPIQLVAVGYAGTILTSADTVTWTPHTTGTQYLQDVVMHGATCVAVGGGGTILTSTDRATWTPQSSGTSAVLNGVASNGTTIVAVGAQPGGGQPAAVLTSPDGTTWTPRTIATHTMMGENALSVRAFGSGFLVVTDYGAIFASPDGATFSLALQAGKSDYPNCALDFLALNDVTYGSTYVAVGNGVIAESATGVAWTSRRAGPEQLVAVANGPPGYVALGQNGELLTSPDGSAWTVRNPGLNGHPRGATFGGSTFVAVGSDASYKTAAFTSGDGVTWTTRPVSGPAGLARVVYGGGKFVAVGAQGSIFTSPDGTAWTPRAAGTADNLRAVAYGASQFVAIGDTTVLTSPDGVTWTGGTLPAFGLTAIAYGSSTFVAVGDQAYSSADGSSWTIEPLAQNTQLLGLAYGGAGFVGVGTCEVVGRRP